MISENELNFIKSELGDVSSKRLMELTDSIQNGILVDIGIYEGASSRIMINNSINNNNIIYAIDPVNPIFNSNHPNYNYIKDDSVYVGEATLGSSDRVVLGTPEDVIDGQVRPRRSIASGRRHVEVSLASPQVDLESEGLVVVGRRWQSRSTAIDTVRRAIDQAGHVGKAAVGVGLAHLQRGHRDISGTERGQNGDVVVPLGINAGRRVTRVIDDQPRGSDGAELEVLCVNHAFSLLTIRG